MPDSKLFDPPSASTKTPLSTKPPHSLLEVAQPLEPTPPLSSVKNGAAEGKDEEEEGGGGGLEIKPGMLAEAVASDSELPSNPPPQSSTQSSPSSPSPATSPSSNSISPQPDPAIAAGGALPSLPDQPRIPPPAPQAQAASPGRPLHCEKIIYRTSCLASRADLVHNISAYT